MTKFYRMRVDSEDWRFSFRFNDMMVTSCEKWKEVVKKDIYNNYERYYNYFMKNEYYQGGEEIDTNFDAWVDFHINFDSYCEEIKVDNFD